MRAIILAASLAALAGGAARAQDAAAVKMGDPAAGEKVFSQCKACHQIGPNAKNAVGPELNGVVGRKAGTVAGYNYSAANKNSGLTWTPEELQVYLANPQGVIKGTKMVFAGIKDPQKVKDLIAYLAQFGPEGQKIGG